MNPPGYEFTSEQNVVLAHLASRMKVVGRVLTVLGRVTAAESIIPGWRGGGSAVGLEVGAAIAVPGRFPPA